MIIIMSHRIFGLVGHPLGHSFSRAFFNKIFAERNMDAEYCNFDLEDISTIRQLISSNPEICGLNVTIPYKEAVIPYLDDLDDTARIVGAVNVIKIERGADNTLTLKGFNSDVTGFARAFCSLLNSPFSPRNALVLGTGGASKAAAFALTRAGLNVNRVSRNPKDNQLSYGDLRNPAVINHYGVIVNTTPLGTYPKVDACPDFPYELLSPAHLCFDLVYNPPLTLFLQRCAQQGCTIKNGLQMLHVQALEAYRIWTGKNLI